MLIAALLLAAAPADDLTDEYFDAWRACVANKTGNAVGIGARADAALEDAFASCQTQERKFKDRVDASQYQSGRERVYLAIIRNLDGGLKLARARARPLR